MGCHDVTSLSISISRPASLVEVPGCRCQMAWSLAKPRGLLFSFAASRGMALRRCSAAFLHFKKALRRDEADVHAMHAGVIECRHACSGIVRCGVGTGMHAACSRWPLPCGDTNAGRHNQGAGRRVLLVLCVRLLPCWRRLWACF